MSSSKQPEQRPTWHLNLTRTLADEWGLTEEEIAAEHLRYKAAELHRWRKESERKVPFAGRWR